MAQVRDPGTARSIPAGGRGEATRTTAAPAGKEEGGDIGEWLGAMADKYDGKYGDRPPQKQLGYTGDERDYRVESPRPGAGPKVLSAVAIALAAFAVLLEVLLPDVDVRLINLLRMLLLPVIMLLFILVWKGGGVIGRSVADRLTRWIH